MPEEQLKSAAVQRGHTNECSHPFLQGILEQGQAEAAGSVAMVLEF